MSTVADLERQVAVYKRAADALASLLQEFDACCATPRNYAKPIYMTDFRTCVTTEPVYRKACLAAASAATYEKTKYIGKCYRVLQGSAGARSWWLYIRVTGMKNDTCVCDMFEMNMHVPAFQRNRAYTVPVAHLEALNFAYIHIHSDIYDEELQAFKMRVLQDPK